MRSGAALEASFRRLWKDYRDTYKLTVGKCSKKHVHDLRTSTRRLVAAVDLLSEAMPEFRDKKLRKLMKKPLRVTSPLRDLQIQIAYARDLIPFHPDLKSLVSDRKKETKGLTRKVGKELADLDMKKIRKGMRALLKSKVFDGEIIHPVLLSAHAAFLRMMAQRERIEPNDTRTIHRIRIALKKFRYAVEFLEPLLPRATASDLKKMKEYQKQMGNIQDIAVILDSLKDFGAKKTTLRQIRDQLLKKRQESIDAFLASAGGLESFWHGPKGD